MVVVYAAHLARPCAEHLARKFDIILALYLARPCVALRDTIVAFMIFYVNQTSYFFLFHYYEQLDSAHSKE